jgi:hypothetical protein
MNGSTHISHCTAKVLNTNDSEISVLLPGHFELRNKWALCAWDLFVAEETGIWGDLSTKEVTLGKSLHLSELPLNHLEDWDNDASDGWLPHTRRPSHIRLLPSPPSELRPSLLLGRCSTT